MTNTLVEFWKRMDLERCKPPYFHPEDKKKVEALYLDVECHTDYLNSLMNTKDGSSKTNLHLNLLPDPYQGDLDRAKVFILLTNPSVSACNYYAEANVPKYKDALIARLNQTRPDDGPIQHMFLDPEFAWTAAFAWWERKLRGVTKIIADEHFDGDYGKALGKVSENIASIELVPYHSLHTPRPSLMRKSSQGEALASTNVARSFISNLRKKRNLTIIVMRRVEDWGFGGPDNDKLAHLDQANIVKYDGKKAQSASLVPDSPGGIAILEAFGIKNSTA